MHLLDNTSFRNSSQTARRNTSQGLQLQLLGSKPKHHLELDFHYTAIMNTIATKNIELLYHSGIGVSNQCVKDITSEIATTVQENMDEFSGVYITPGLSKNLPIRCSSDNIDAKVDS